MAVTDRKISNRAKVGWKPIRLHLGVSATGQTAKRTDAVTPGFRFQVMAVEADALTVTAAITFDVQIGTTSVLAAAITPVADTPTAGTLSTTLANRRGSATGILNLKYTSDGTGEATNGIVTVWIRPLGMNGDAP